jgi:hypothetical protein
MTMLFGAIRAECFLTVTGTALPFTAFRARISLELRLTVGHKEAFSMLVLMPLLCAMSVPGTTKTGTSDPRV